MEGVGVDKIRQEEKKEGEKEKRRRRNTNILGHCGLAKMV